MLVNVLGKRYYLTLVETVKKNPEANIIDDKNTVLEAIPIEYQQEHTLVKTSCIWLAACLVVRSENSKLASIPLTKYQQDPSKFEWLHMLNKNAPTEKTFYNNFRLISE